MSTIHTIGEDLFLEQLSSILPPVENTISIGDDCAVLSGGLLLKTDCIVETVHFLSDENPSRIGRKAIARVISDFAAMGGCPKELLVTLGITGNTSLNYLNDLYKGMIGICEEFSCHIVGGETTSLPDDSARFFSISGTGQLFSETPILRSTAQNGDHLYVTGRLGGSLDSGRHLTFTPRVAEAKWLVKNARPSAMMDLSDGVAKDLPKLANASEVGYNIDVSSLPCHDGCTVEQALGDGEDYELLFAIDPVKAAQLETSPFLCTKIGELTSESKTPLVGGWEHFQSK